MVAIDNDWLDPLHEEFQKPYYRDLCLKLKEEYNTHTIYPPADDIFNAFSHTPLANVKAVILGQDPYHEEGQAHGLCFSVQKGVEIPPSLKNIYQELHDDVGFVIPDHGDLTKWADEGVLLLNNVLTVRAHAAYSHANIGWERFTDAVIKILNAQDRPMVFLLWGKSAQTRAKDLNNPDHLILKCPHPSPLSAYRGFFGCRHFSKTNAFLIEHHIKPIDWQI